jgi:hypothetical protein
MCSRTNELRSSSRGNSSSRELEQQRHQGAGAVAGTPATRAAAAAGAKAGAAETAEVGAIRSFLYAIVPAVLGDIVAAAALGIDTEVDVPKER